MNDTFDDELRRSLHTHADQVPRRPDLSRSAMSQARGIRRRRRIASGIAAAALVAVALPLGLKVGDAITNGQEPVEPPPPTGPTQVELDLRAMPADDSPAIPYLAHRTVVADQGRIEIPGTARIEAVAPVVGGAYVATGRTVTHYDWDGTPRPIGPISTPPVASADGGWAVYGTRGTGTSRGGVTLHLVEVETGDESTTELPDADGPMVSVLAVVDGRVFFSYDTPRGRDVGLQVWDADDGTVTEVPGDLNATAVSSDGQLVAHVTKLVDFGSCSAMLDQDADETLWRTCDYQVKGFSPDGRFAWATPAYADGYGPTTITILDARSGEVVRHFKAEFARQHPITFFTTVFEDRDSLLLQSEQEDGTALLRCDVLTGDCKAAEPLADGKLDVRGGPPYLLPEVR